MDRIKLGHSPDCHKLTFNGKEFKIQVASESTIIPAAKTETAQVDVINNDTGYLKLEGHEQTLAQLKLPINYCELGRGWILDKLNKIKKR